MRLEDYLNNMKQIKEDSLKFYSDSTYYLSDDDKSNILKYIEDNPDMGIPIEDFGVEDFNENWQKYAYDVDYNITDEDFSYPTEAEVIGTTPPSINPSPGPGIGRKLISVYKYAAPKYGRNNIAKNSRDFCRRIVSLTNIRLLTYNEIRGLNGSNPGFGRNGANRYSVFRARGGKNCNHIWVKFFYSIAAKTFILAPDNKQPVQPSLR